VPAVRVAQRAIEELGVDSPLHQVVLRPAPDGGGRRGDVALTAQDDDGQVGHTAQEAAQRVQASAVRQVEVEQHDLDFRLLDQHQRLLEASGANEVRRGGALLQQLLQVERVGVVIFDQE
jgi:hypothetical protein